MISVPREKFEKMQTELDDLREQVKISNDDSQEEGVDHDLVRQFNESLEDLKAGRFKRVA